MDLPTDDHTKVSHSSKDVAWYKEELDDFSPECRELLEKYSYIPPDQVKAHIREIRERAWAVFPYPCIGQWRFLHLSISLQPCYQRVLSRLKEPQSRCTLLDMACCFAQDIRKLVYDGAPSENLYACDLRQEYMDLGYELFRDRDKMTATFINANILEEPGSLDQLYGKIDIIHAASFFHLFGWEDQLKICKRVIKILKPQKSSLIFGRQTGNVKGTEVVPKTHGLHNSSTIWRHDPDSFKRLWDIAGRETDTKWKTWAELEERRPDHWAEDGIRRMKFEVERLE